MRSDTPPRPTEHLNEAGTPRSPPDRRSARLSLAAHSTDGSTERTQAIRARRLAHVRAVVFISGSCAVDCARALLLRASASAGLLISQDATSAKKVPYVMRRACFLLELSAARHVLLVPIGTDFNVADLFTKVLAIEKFNTFTAYILGEDIK